MVSFIQQPILPLIALHNIIDVDVPCTLLNQSTLACYSGFESDATMALSVIIYFWARRSFPSVEINNEHYSLSSHSFLFCPTFHHSRHCLLVY